jgi:hypothetical protein
MTWLSLSPTRATSEAPRWAVVQTPAIRSCAPPCGQTRYVVVDVCAGSRGPGPIRSIVDTLPVESLAARLDWEYLRARMEVCPWSPAARAAGLWAIDALHADLGPRWPRAWQQANSAPPELAACSYSLAAFIGTLDLALALYRIRELPGARVLRDTIRGTARYDALMSPRLQMRMASVALAAATDVTIEPTMPGAAAPRPAAIPRRSVLRRGGASRDAGRQDARCQPMARHNHA